MNNSAWSNLKYIDPSALLVGLDELFESTGIKKYNNPADILLRRKIRNISEDRRCAIFCHGASHVFGRKIFFAPYENVDYDYVGAYKYQGTVCRFPIQLKQLVPNRINATTSIQIEITKLKKYIGTDDLVVALHVNRRINIKSQDLDVSELKLKELWIFGLKQQNTWLLIGNLMASNPIAYEFKLPDFRIKR